MLELTMD